MPRGGMRVGAGRKPGARQAIIIGMDGQRRPDTSSGSPGASASPAVVDDPDHLAEPPDDLRRDQQEVWRRLACQAIAQRTLTPTTVPGFRELCEQFVVKQALFRRMERLGLASDKAEGARKRYEKMAQRVDSTLARFKLTAFGKPVDGASAAKKAGANPWAQVAQ